MMSRLVRLWPWAIALLAVLGYGCEERKAGALGAQLAIRTRERDALMKSAKQQRVVFQRDTVILTKTVTRWETLRDSVIRTDTLLRRDTVVRTIIATADTTIRACRETVRSCTAALAMADSLHSLDVRTIRTLERNRPGTLRRWGDRLLWGSVGYTVGTLTRK